MCARKLEMLLDLRERSLNRCFTVSPDALEPAVKEAMNLLLAFVRQGIQDILQCRPPDSA